MAAKALRPSGRDGGLAAAGDHHVGVVVLDGLEGVADGVGGAGAGGRPRRVRAAQPELDRNLPAGRVGHQLGDGEGRDLVRAFLEQPGVLDLDLLQAADARAEDHAAAERVFLGEIEPGVAHGVDRRRPGRTGRSGRAA